MAGNTITSIGIDGYKGQWLAVILHQESFLVKIFKTISELCQAYPHADVYLIDIPIGLPESRTALRPDSLVKKELGRKGASIFPVPCRQAVYSETKQKAREQNIAILGKSISEQTLGITKAIRQVDTFLQQHPRWKNRLLESHPEFCFAKLNKNIPIYESKLTAAGRQKRLDILRPHFSKADKVIEAFLQEKPQRKKLDDVVDALCLAVAGMLIVKRGVSLKDPISDANSAQNNVNSGVKTIPSHPMKDSTGLFMQIVYPELSQKLSQELP